MKTLSQQFDKALYIQEKRALDAERELARLRTACMEGDNYVEQTLGKALGYPWYKDDQKNFAGTTEHDGVCVGEHTAESIAFEAAKRIEFLAERTRDLRRELDNAEKFRTNLSAIIGCSSPDGEAEIGVIECILEKMYTAEKRANESAEREACQFEKGYRKGRESATNDLIDARVKGHGEGQEHTISDVNAGLVDDLIAPRLLAAYQDSRNQIVALLAKRPELDSDEGDVVLDMMDDMIFTVESSSSYVSRQEADAYLSDRDAGDENDFLGHVYSPEIKQLLRRLADAWRP